MDKIVRIRKLKGQKVSTRTPSIRCWASVASRQGFRPSHQGFRRRLDPFLGFLHSASEFGDEPLGHRVNYRIALKGLHVRSFSHICEWCSVLPLVYVQELVP
jgi:hypothetical protein